MNARTRFWKSGWKAGVCIWVLLAATTARSQQPASPGEPEGVRTRQLWNTKFREKRPAAASPEAPAGTANATAAPARAPRPEPSEADEDAMVGITFWRLRESRAGDSQSVSHSEGGSTWTPERLGAEIPVVAGEKIRVGIETARRGYLYVLDREQYVDGTFSTPMLIFPTARTRGGNNVTAGRLIEIPAWTDNPPYFTLRISQPNQIAEVLTVLVTPEPLPELQNAQEAARVPLRLVESWEKQWGGQVSRLNTSDETGMGYTRAEKEAAAVGTRYLTQEDPLPQAVYHKEAKPDDPVLVNIRVPIVK